MTSRPSDVRHGREGRVRLLVVGLVALAFLLAGTIGYQLSQAADETFARATAASRNVFDVVSRDLARNIELYDTALRGAIAARAFAGFDALPGEVKRGLMFDGAFNARDLGAIMVADTNGNIVLDSRSPTPRVSTVADRDYFKVHRDRNDLGLYISVPFLERTAGHSAIALSRRLNGPDGRFAGVIFGTFRLSYFRELTDGLDLGERGAITLMNSDGILLARTPWIPSIIGADMSDSSAFRQLNDRAIADYEAVAVFDKVRRYYTAGRIGDFPLVLHVATGIDSIYAGWRRGALIVGSVTAAATLALIGVAGLLALELRRRRQAELEAQETAERFRVLADNASDVIVRLGIDGTRRYVSPSIEEVLGYTAAELLGRGWHTIVHPDDRPIIDEALAELRAGTQQSAATYRCQRKDGAEVWMEARIRMLRHPKTGEPEELIATSRDVTWRHKAEQELARLAASDPLTGIPNRRTFDEIFDLEWRRAMRDRASIALLMIDVDHFKSYNDRYGHPAGDRALRFIARTIAFNTRRPNDLAARYGGEEFAVLLPGSDAEGAKLVADRIRQDVEQLAIPHESTLAGRVTISVGVAVATASPGMAVDALIETADAALYGVKKRGRGQVALIAVQPVREAAD